MSNETTYDKVFSEQLREVKTPEDAARNIMGLTEIYLKYNSDLFFAYSALALVSREIENSTDEATGKPISSAKAKVLVAATKEALKYEEVKMHVENVNKCIHAFEAMQRALEASVPR